MATVPAYLENLNPEQKKAVTHAGGPAVVLAGAGSGKTRVLTTRAAWLIDEQQLSPESLLLVTFTNKAAGEMKKRISHMTGLLPQYVGTFHSLCAKILRRDGYAINLPPGYTIYDADDQLALLKQIYKTHHLSSKELNPRSVKATISKLKNELLSPMEYQEIAYGRYQEQTAQIYDWYQQALTKAEAVDFDDLLTKTVELLQKQPAILSRYQRLFAHVLVDEYQDTNKAQYQLIKLLALPQNNLFIVGDFSQSIYAWRGADYRNLLHFQKDFAPCAEYRLERNYRSTQSILDTASAIISHNKSHPILKLWTENSVQEKYTCTEAANQMDEAAQVAQIIRSHLDQFKYEQMAILYRTNAQSRAFEEEFLKAAIPYRIVGGYKFYERKEVKDLLAYLRVIINSHDQVSEQRALKIGKRRFTQLKSELPVADFEQLVNLPPAQLLEKIIKVTNYLEKFDGQLPEDQARLDNIKELLNVASQFEQTHIFLENVALIQDDYLADLDSSPDNNKVNLMSLHSAKGLEFEVVFLVGMEDGLLPHSRSFFDQEQMEEERRLCYVGITRSKQKLYFSYARHRFNYQTPSKTVPSRFLADIPQSLLSFVSDHPAPRFAQLSGQAAPIDDQTFTALINDDLDVISFLDQ